jgi:hypothetical protein
MNIQPNAKKRAKKHPHTLYLLHGVSGAVRSELTRIGMYALSTITAHIVISVRQLAIIHLR